MANHYSFNRMELAGSFGDLGTILPLAIGMIMVNGLSPHGLFFSVGLFYLFSGVYYGVTVPVQPMKVIGAYAVATSLTPSQIGASGLLVGLFLLVLGGTGAMGLLGKYIPKSVVRGVQMATGTLLMAQGVRFMAGTSKYQLVQGMVEPHLNVQAFAGMPVGIVIGIIGAVITLFFLDNKRFPAGILVVIYGFVLGLVWGIHGSLNLFIPGIFMPELLPFGFPSGADFSFVLIALVLPQLPMTIGNAVVANADLSRDYFGDNSKRVTYKALCISMGLANLVSFMVGGMPLCHGAGGLAAHYRFGARTAGSNLMIGLIFLVLAIFLGPHILGLINLIPFSVLGVLLIFAGSQLSLTLLDINDRKDLFVVLIMLGITLASNLAVGFIVGIVLSYALKSDRMAV
ncbi:SulP1 [Desulforapulum autotrophicum HRM2]|uniref:SulP1 n=1 Tax=Desulforapulum autotrophicum (strain ATCC 43914 / DSM 3382 / VKM B-1955 / HRM2) TaxID=177437 RepID=C0Q8U9_DESAH|nr:putative sulfate/molybdate transporter [Desulforapulum autotrophicum]ACN14439.1 SulP1 [Desulforapulum autotrophicum HRM2]